MSLSISFHFDDDKDPDVLDMVIQDGKPTSKQWERVSRAAMRQYFKHFGEERTARDAERKKEYGE